MRLLRQALEQAQHQAALCLCRCRNSPTLGEAHLRAGRLEEAHTLAAHALAYFRTHQERGREANTLRLLGELPHIVLPRQSQRPSASYRQALALAEALGMRPLRARCHRGLGTLYATTGQRGRACTELATAVEMYRGMAMTFWLPETEAALAQVEGR